MLYNKEEKHEKHLRIIYTRYLERGVSKCVSYLLKEEHDDKEKFLTFVESVAKPILKAQKVPLDNSYYNGLETLMESLMTLKDREFDLEETRRDVLRRANGLQKILREKNSRKEKHKKKKFEDGY